MKQFIIKLIIFVLVLVFSDLALSGLFKLYDYTKGGEIQKIHAIMTKETPDLLILGSSRASHHYVPSVIEDSLNVTVYNAGLDGQGTCMSYGFLKGIGHRKYPRYIVCEMTPVFDIYNSHVSLNNFYPYIDRKDIKSLIISFDQNERWKLLSNSYRLNSALFRLIPSILFDRRAFIKGYSPSYGKLSKNIDTKSANDNAELGKTLKDKLKERYLNELISDAKKNNCRIAFFISPIYQGSDSLAYSEEIEILRKNNVPVFNHLNDERFINTPEYFSDQVHLNNDGAIQYSKIIVNELIASE